MRIFMTVGVALFGLALHATPAQADEPLFGYVVTTDVVPKGKVEAEQWVTFREGRSQGSYHLLQTRNELSYGLTNDLQISGYVNFARADVKGNAPDGSTSPPEIFADFQVDPAKRFKKSRFETVSAEAIWRIASPYTKPVGLAIYVEPSIGSRTFEFETRLIAQKNFIDDRLVFAANITYGIEVRRLPGEFGAVPGTPEAQKTTDHETDLNFGIAGSYRFAPRLSAGFELLNEREWAGFNAFRTSRATNVGYFLGPNFHFGGRHLFATTSLLFQLKRAEDHDNPPPGFIVNGFSNADDFEKIRLRIKIGYNF